MATLASLVERFLEQERGAANILPASTVTAQAVAAAGYYAGFADLEVPPASGEAISETTDISVSEWAEIRPLFLLYVERETALQLEATRSMGAEVFGRTSSEVGMEITQLEADYARRVFCFPVFTV
ncbi:MAG: hypothetical protein B7X51_09450 [Pseudomonas sp. 34-62-33]|nr:MAG: hypothetical protein B7X51_09450 [Pseudomonas sp. 34-62-33]